MTTKSNTGSKMVRNRQNWNP